MSSADSRSVAVTRLAIDGSIEHPLS